ncbi:hypothetical protein [Flavilitoribacter nigricans]|uniref:Uncharacterized protein n=1 Tax=Flavilitoribacter nigricans (strain ATCC 23147 / DSM 23189 / NBRC 102662 / NCIMB 1420 / SS-2) TaxID=1122177 RepID=A0A2D0N965_FLAN2|nr:hypothetical protein [Flavilitoribacter nigricans]PHN04323.1 hypothetical protein CRP01_22435 [Flavilitoribacter nigricans DSM 23189 = NBRC 102662]
MNPIDNYPNMNGNFFPNRKLKWILFPCILISLLLQIEATISYFKIEQIQSESSIFFCFYSPYQNTWIVELLAQTGLAIAIFLFFNRNREVPLTGFQKLTLLAPALILVMDQIMRHLMW